jgi:hypothetical protein
MKAVRWQSVFIVAIALWSSISGEALARPSAPVRLVCAEGPVLVVRNVVGSPARVTATPAEDDRAVALALGSLAERDRRKIADEIANASARVEARLSPFGADLGDGDPIEELYRGLAPYTPALAAARALAGGVWRISEREVRVAASCESARPAQDETCVPLWGQTDAPRDVVGRARFAGWAAAHAAVVDMGDVAARDRCVAALRARVANADSPAALVLTADDLVLHPNAQTRSLVDATRAMRAVGAGDHEIDGVAEEVSRRGTTNGMTSDTAERVAPWLSLSASSLVVVPRLSALTRLPRVDAEIANAAGGSAGVRWIHRASED